ncbi:MAG: hypothetical protein M1829_005757 [Trizodia sp. TS-e1964]|nr:MAG: hypothetical protein M1829_005757 [Trizodia sp. TS-e1964]
MHSLPLSSLGSLIIGFLLSQSVTSLNLPTIKSRSPSENNSNPGANDNAAIPNNFDLSTKALCSGAFYIINISKNPPPFTSLENLPCVSAWSKLITPAQRMGTECGNFEVKYVNGNLVIRNIFLPNQLSLYCNLGATSKDLDCLQSNVPSGADMLLEWSTEPLDEHPSNLHAAGHLRVRGSGSPTWGVKTVMLPENTFLIPKAPTQGGKLAIVCGPGPARRLAVSGPDRV